MKTLYLECNMGAAGDMLMAALLELQSDKEEAVKRLNSLGIPGVEIKSEARVKCGITGTGISVMINGVEEEGHDVSGHHHDHEHSHHVHEEHHHSNDHNSHIHEKHHHDHSDHGDEEPHHHHGHHHSHTHHHTSMKDVEHIISHLDVSQKVKDDAIAVYQRIAEAESAAHGRKVEEIHFHEVGTTDAVADVVGVCYLMNELKPDKVIASPVHVGSGQVKCAHGILPVPAPATAYILKGVPIYGGRIKGELCTPTGAALLKHFVTEFGEMPIMAVKQIGYGMGKKDFEDANCVRALLGEQQDQTGIIYELCCNIDDMTAEEIGFATGRLLEQGALDAFTTPIQMKKNRPAVLLTCLCRESDKEEFIKLIFQHTSTIGIREHMCKRYELERKTNTIDTVLGEVRFKEVSGYGVMRKKAEYDDIAEIAKKQGLSLSEVKQEIMK